MIIKLKILDKIKFAFKIMQLDLRLSYLSTNTEAVNLEKLFEVNYYKLGIFVDLNCAKSEEIFNHVQISIFIKKILWQKIKIKI